jgi:hypothetical protein
MEELLAARQSCVTIKTKWGARMALSVRWQLDFAVEQLTNTANNFFELEKDHPISCGPGGFSAQSQTPATATYTLTRLDGSTKKIILATYPGGSDPPVLDYGKSGSVTLSRPQGPFSRDTDTGMGYIYVMDID